jgi:hypothetical protein
LLSCLLLLFLALFFSFSHHKEIYSYLTTTFAFWPFLDTHNFV